MIMTDDDDDAIDIDEGDDNDVRSDYWNIFTGDKGY